MAGAAAGIFAPRKAMGEPNMLLAEAGTGIGKTLAYLAPASLWAERAGGTVWVSTFTKALQRQLDAESARIVADPEERKKRIVIRKGRENYLCLLNLEDAMQGAFAGRAAVLAQLVGRWAAYSKDGDMVGGDLPGWLPSLFRRAGAAALTDRRGECVYAGCPHYRKCFIERAERAGREADIVIANHALVMVNAARGRPDAPTRIVFDEGHHLFDAADSTFSAALTGQEAIEMRRWIVGPEGKARGRRRGLAARLMDVCSYDEAGAEALDAAVEAARGLPTDGWLQRIADGDPFGPLERLLGQVRGTVYARSKAQEAGYGLETELAEPDGALVSAAAAAMEALEALARPLAALTRRLEAILEDAPDWLDSQARARVEGAISGLTWRRETLGAWIALLGRVGGVGDPDFVDWLTIERVEGREYDMGIRRHWLDPTKPLAQGGARARARRAGDLGDAARGGGLAERRRAHRGEPPRRRDGAFRGAEPVRLWPQRRSADRHRFAARRHLRAGGGLCEADRDRAGRDAGAVHRDPAAARGPCADRRPAGARRAAAAGAACRPDRHGDAGRYLPRRSALVAAGHRCAARRGGRAGRIAAAGGDGARAVAAPERAPRGAAAGQRRQRL